MESGHADSLMESGHADSNGFAQRRSIERIPGPQYLRHILPLRDSTHGRYLRVVSCEKDEAKERINAKQTLFQKNVKHRAKKKTEDARFIAKEKSADLWIRP